MTPRPLPRSTPSAEAVDARGVLALLDALDAAPELDPHSLVVVRGGSVVAEGWWDPFTADRRHLLYSLSKSFTSAAAGFAVAEGLLDLDTTVLSHFPELDAEVTDPRSRRVLVRHVASMASGHTAETVDRAEAVDPTDLVRGFLLTPPEEEPGSVFAYNQPCTFTLGAIVQRASGQTLTEFLRPRLLDPLGIGDVAWLQRPGPAADGTVRGLDLGWSGLHATTEAVAALGLLHLRGGVWEGRQLLPAAWVAEATREHVATAGAMPNPDWSCGYGFQFWVARHGYRGDGAYGQYCLVLPEQDAVVAITGDTEDMQLVLDLVWEHLLPALGADRAATDPGGAAAADAELAARLAALALPPVTGEARAGAGAPAPGEAVHLVPEGGRCEGQPTLTGVVLTADGDGWELLLQEAAGDVRVRAEGAGWAVSETSGSPGGRPLATAVSAAWDGPSLRAEVRLLETPHRFAVTATPSAGTFTGCWVTAPLHAGPISAKRAPEVPAPEVPAP